MTQLEQFLLKPGTNRSLEKEFIVPSLGENLPIKIRVITQPEYQQAMVSATKWNKDGTSKREIPIFMSKVCLAGMVDPNPNIDSYIKKADENVQQLNAEASAKALEEYNKQVEEWEKEGKDPNNKPEKKEPKLQKRILTPQDLLEHWFFPGEITEIAEKILEMSGFGISLEEAVKKSKN